MLNRNSREAKLRAIQELSFSLADTRLYLDTHPNDRRAIAFFKKNAEKLDAAVKEFTSQYGPIDQNYIISNDRWNWVDMPWPWQEGVED